MARRPNPFLIDAENPELTGQDFARMKPAAEVLPRDVYDALVAGEAEKRQHGPGKKRAKVPVSLRLDPDTLAAIKAVGPGWQGAVNDVLTRAAASGRFVRREAVSPGTSMTKDGPSRKRA